MSSENPTPSSALHKRLYALDDAAHYLGVSKELFNDVVRPSLHMIRLGKRAIRFDKLDLDAWIAQHKQLYGCPMQPKEVAKWDNNTNRVASKKGVTLGISTKPLTGDEYGKARARLIAKRRSST